ncbi:MAG: CoA-binding protein [Bacteroidetes bacterium]|nr:MAG: CoA-binding protein [Bacteroidota bacterium]REK06960.1 MAG: CoA-binding protein [Bacteroidota bacterium]REK33692.1 MAG: CoA-binding protein [Bacteroidota bacterium]REK47231.1 MAG: CoA-binding protein [Bacteroidota bacterium]
MEKYTLVVGASEKTDRYSNRAVRSLRNSGNSVYALGYREGMIADVPILKGRPQFANPVHTITLYLNASRQEELEDYFLSLKPERIIFNPGAENPRLEKRARAEGIICENACTLVMIATGQY